MSSSSRSFTALLLFLTYFLAASEAGHHNHHHNHKRALSLPNDLPAGWSYTGCYTDSVGARTLPGATFNGNTMTDESCVSFCLNKGYPYAGTEYGGECYCGTTIASTATTAPSTDCNVRPHPVERVWNPPHPRSGLTVRTDGLHRQCYPSLWCWEQIDHLPHHSSVGWPSRQSWSSRLDFGRLFCRLCGGKNTGERCWHHWRRIGHDHRPLHVCLQVCWIQSGRRRIWR